MKIKRFYRKMSLRNIFLPIIRDAHLNNDGCFLVAFQCKLISEEIGFYFLNNFRTNIIS